MEEEKSAIFPLPFHNHQGQRDLSKIRDASYVISNRARERKCLITWTCTTIETVSPPPIASAIRQRWQAKILCSSCNVSARSATICLPPILNLHSTKHKNAIFKD